MSELALLGATQGEGSPSAVAAAPGVRRIDRDDGGTQDAGRWRPAYRREAGGYSGFCSTPLWRPRTNMEEGVGLSIFLQQLLLVASVTLPRDVHGAKL